MSRPDEHRECIELRWEEAIAGLSARQRVARWWRMNWPGVTLIAVLLAMAGGLATW